MNGSAASDSAGFLSSGELATLTAVCDALVPAVEGVEPAEFFQLRASALGVPRLLAGAIASLPDPEQRTQFKQLLGLFESRLANLLLAGRFQRFSALAEAERERYLLGWAQSALGRRRMGFQVLKRLACFLFYTAGEGGNPTWPAIGYPGPVTAAPNRPRELRVVPVDGDATLEAEVCVVGSGAGGAVVAAELAAAGHAVLVLEKGGYFDEADFRNRELEGMRNLYMDGGLLSTKDLGMALLAGRCLGGGTVVNWCTCFRPPVEILEEWEREHGVGGLLGPALQVSFDGVERRLNVNDRESAHNAQNAVLARGCASLGYHVGTTRRNVLECKDSGFCGFGCQEGAKQSTLATYLRDAQRHGAHFVVNCTAEQVRIRAGQVEGVAAVVYDPATGRQHRLVVRAPAVVVAAGAIHSPVLLLRSGLSHPALGRHLHLHPTAAVSGVFAEPIEPWQGAPQTTYSDQFVNLTGRFGFKLEVPPVHPGLGAMSLPWQSGLEHKRRMLQVAHLASIIVLTRDRDAGRVTLSQAGNPVVEYWPSAFDSAHLVRGQHEAARVLAAAGALEVGTLHALPLRWRQEEGAAGLRRFGETLARQEVRPNRLLLFSAHQMGTCRMGGSAATAVVNPEGKVYGLRGLWVADGSIFPSASGVNPMITIMGLAHRVAQFVKASV